jgi:hypothetical protein
MSSTQFFADGETDLPNIFKSQSLSIGVFRILIRLFSVFREFPSICKNDII